MVLTHCVARTRGALQPASQWRRCSASLSVCKCWRVRARRLVVGGASQLTGGARCRGGQTVGAFWQRVCHVEKVALAHFCPFFLSPSSLPPSSFLLTPPPSHLHPLPFQIFSVTPCLRFSAPKRDTLPPCLWASLGRCLREVTMFPVAASIRCIPFVSRAGLWRE